MKIGKYYISFRKLWTSVLAVTTAITSIDSPYVPTQYRLAVQIIASIVLAFNFSPVEKFTPELFEKDAFTAATSLEPLIPPAWATDLKEAVSLLKTAQAGYNSVSATPTSTITVVPGVVTGTTLTTLGDQATAAITANATPVVGTPLPSVVNTVSTTPV